nr:hypothetical protein [Tanacetum cinerariifolium]
RGGRRQRRRVAGKQDARCEGDFDALAYALHRRAFEVAAQLSSLLVHFAADERAPRATHHGTQNSPLSRARLAADYAAQNSPAGRASQAADDTAFRVVVTGRVFLFVLVAANGASTYGPAGRTYHGPGFAANQAAHYGPAHAPDYGAFGLAAPAFRFVLGLGYRASQYEECQDKCEETSERFHVEKGIEKEKKAKQRQAAAISFLTKLQKQASLEGAVFGRLFHLLVGKNGHFHAAVGLAAFGGSVVGHWLRRAVALRSNAAAGYFLGREAVGHGLGAAFAQRLVDGIGARIVGVAFHQDVGIGVFFQCSG